MGRGSPSAAPSAGLQGVPREEQSGPQGPGGTPAQEVPWPSPAPCFRGSTCPHCGLRTCLEPESQGREMSLWSLGLRVPRGVHGQCLSAQLCVSPTDPQLGQPAPGPPSQGPWPTHPFVPNCCLCSEACLLGTLRLSSPFSGRLAGPVWLLEAPHKCHMPPPPASPRVWLRPRRLLLSRQGEGHPGATAHSALCRGARGIPSVLMDLSDKPWNPGTEDPMALVVRAQNAGPHLGLRGARALASVCIGPLGGLSPGG